MPARATASRTASAPSCGAVKSFSAPRNLPVGRADGGEDDGVVHDRVRDLRDGVGAEQLLKLWAGRPPWRGRFPSATADRPSGPCSVVPSSSTDVTRASAGPTASCQAKLVRLRRRRLAAHDLGETRRRLWIDLMDANRQLSTPADRIAQSEFMNIMQPCASSLRPPPLAAPNCSAPAGFTSRSLPSDVDETPAGRAKRRRPTRSGSRATRPGTSPGSASRRGRCVLGGRHRGGPATDGFSASRRDAADAARMLRLLSGRTHEVLTAVVSSRAARDGRSVVGHRGSFHAR